ncbi:DUF4398 domain-containing protein [Alteromonadaceae bacterium M269]|nr:DUF4398 domain-containing protein [Alteromonadaceae bacterium M269]
MNVFRSTSDLQWLSRLKGFVTIACVTALLSACANTPSLSTEAIWAASATIHSAERARVGKYAPAELTLARNFLYSARQAMKQIHMKSATQLAQQSLVTAQLAIVRAELIKAQHVNAKIREKITQLEQKIQRNNGEGL